MILHFMRQTRKENEGYYDKKRISQETFDCISSSGTGTPLGKCTSDIIIKPNQKSGGNGLAFFMRGEDYQPNVSSGGNTYTFGMQGDEKSFMVEMDSQYNGAYCDMNETGDIYPFDENRPYYYESLDYDNQLYFHKDQTYTGQNNYENKFNPYEGTDGREYTAYRNYKYAERFDHIGITLNSDHARHDAIYYLNGLDPVKTVEKTKDGKTYTAYENLAYFDACATRFADAGVNDRLFTVWIDYDGEKMYVRYANGDFANAKRPAKPQIEKKLTFTPVLTTKRL